MYLIGWGIPVVIVAISAGYGLPNDMYIQPRPAPSSCPAGEILYSQGSQPEPDRLLLWIVSIIYDKLKRKFVRFHCSLIGMPVLKYATCWLSTISGMTWVFIAPAIAVILFNLVILCKVVQVKRINIIATFSLSFTFSVSVGYRPPHHLVSTKTENIYTSVIRLYHCELF